MTPSPVVTDTATPCETAADSLQSTECVLCSLAVSYLYCCSHNQYLHVVMSNTFGKRQETRRLRGDQIKVFKILNGYENIDRNIFFTVKEERRTRGHGVTLAKKQCRLDIRKFSFSQRIVNEWNRFSADCVGASSVNIFKK